MSDAKIYVMPGSGRTDPIVLLEMAKDWNCDEIVIVGLNFNNNKTKVSLGSSENDIHRILGFLDSAKHYVHNLRKS